MLIVTQKRYHAIVPSTFRRLTLIALRSASSLRLRVSSTGVRLARLSLAIIVAGFVDVFGRPIVDDSAKVTSVSNIESKNEPDFHKTGSQTDRN